MYLSQRDIVGIDHSITVNGCLLDCYDWELNCCIVLVQCALMLACPVSDEMA